MVEVEEKIEIVFIDKRLKKLQEALLQMNVDLGALNTQIGSVEKEIEALRTRKVRIMAVLDEENKEETLKAEE